MIVKQSQVCTTAGKPAVTVQSYKDQPTSILSVRSDRADVFFSYQASLTYFTLRVQKTNGQLEVVGTGQHNGFGDLYQGSVLEKDSPLTSVILAAYHELFGNGTYAAIMKKWNLSDNMNQAGQHLMDLGIILQG
ncbi:MAG: hypothetical protein ACR5LD_04250 [Symbiopectobacterium sp.]